MGYNAYRERFQNHTCEGCGPEEGRHVGCHATCERYLTEQARIQQEKAELHKDKSAEMQQLYRQRDAADRVKRRAGR